MGLVSINAGTRSKASASGSLGPAFQAWGLRLGTVLRCSGPCGLSGRGLWRSLYNLTPILSCTLALQLPVCSYHPPPHYHKTNFPHCFSKAEMEGTVVVANKYFSKAFCPKPSALENSNGDQMEFFLPPCTVPSRLKGRPQIHLTL